MSLDEGYSGPLLVEAGGDGATYVEEARPTRSASAPPTSCSTVVPAYTDGQIVSATVVTPVTTWARAYAEYRMSRGDTVAVAWSAAVSALEAAFDLSSVTSKAPALLDDTVTMPSAAVKYALVLAGLSQTAYDYPDSAGMCGGPA